MVGLFNYHWSEIWLLPGINKSIACCKVIYITTNKLRYFLEPKLRSPKKATGTLEGQLIQRNLPIPIWKKTLGNGLTNLNFLVKQLQQNHKQYTLRLLMVLNKFTYAIKPFLTFANILKSGISWKYKIPPDVYCWSFLQKMKRKLLSLLVKYVGMDIVIFCDIAKNKHKNSRAVTASIAKKLVQYTSQKM